MGFEDDNITQPKLYRRSVNGARNGDPFERMTYARDEGPQTSYWASWLATLPGLENGDEVLLATENKVYYYRINVPVPTHDVTRV